MALLTSFSVFAGRADWLAGRRRSALLMLGCALLVLLPLANYWRAGPEAIGAMQAHIERIGRLDKLLLQLGDAESNARGYLISRDRAYLRSYGESITNLGLTLEEIRRQFAAGPDSNPELSELPRYVDLKLHVLAEALERGRIGGGISRRSDAEGKRATEHIRDIVSGLKEREAARSQVLFATSAKHFQHYRWLAAALAIILCFLLFVLHRMLQAQAQLRGQFADILESENRRLDAAVQARTAELSDLASFLTHAREEDTARLARELHDELGALLSAVKMDAAWLARKLDPAAPASWQERFGRLMNTLDRGIVLKRRLIDGLRPPLLEEFGLVEALRAMAEDFRRGGDTQLVLDLPVADVDLPRDRALALYRIAQEGLTNIRQHAQARQVRLGLRREGQWTALWLADDGRGFEPRLSGARGHGLSGMRQRVQMFSGEFEVNSRPGEGTRIVARIATADLEPLLHSAIRPLRMA